MARKNLRRASYQRYVPRPERTRTTANDILALSVVTLIIVAVMFVFIRVSSDKREDIAAEDSATIVKKLNELNADVKQAPAQQQLTIDIPSGCVMVQIDGRAASDQSVTPEIFAQNAYRCVGTCTNPPQGQDVGALCRPMAAGGILPFTQDRIRCRCDLCSDINENPLLPVTLPGQAI